MYMSHALYLCCLEKAGDIDVNRPGLTGGNDSPRRRGGFRRGAGGTTSPRLKGATASTSGPGALTAPTDPIFWKVLEYWRLGDWRRPCTLPLGQ
jgi:hypothetical protein